MDQASFERMAESFSAFHREFAPFFGRPEAMRRSEQYLRGLLVQQTDRRNAENVAEVVEGASPRALQRFLSNSPWSSVRVLKKLRDYVAQRLNDPEGVFVVDETSFPKQGKQSVGVARQYCGALGKVANCQAAVFLAYVSPRGHALVDGELFLPQQWIADPARCRKAGVPEGTGYQTMLELALAQLRRAQQEGRLQGQWVTADEHYGEGQDFRDALDTEGWLYVLEVQRTTKVFAQPSRAEIPARRRHSPGRHPTRPRLVEGEPGPQTVEEIAASLTATDWRVLTVAEGAQGPRSYQFAARRVWERRDEVPDRECWLVFRRNRDGSESKYYLSNAPRETPLLCLAQVGARRWPVESEFQTAKGETGLDEYEVRSWQGWHHHMVLALLAGAFLLTLQQEWGKKDAPGDPASDCTGAAGSTPSAGVEARPIARLARHDPATPGTGQARSCQATPYRVC